MTTTESPTSSRLRATRSRLALVVAAAALLLSPALLLGGSVSATGVARTFTLSGSITVDTPPALTIPAGSTFTATIDPVTGGFTDGVLSIPTFDRGPVSGPQAYITLAQIGLATGSIDPVTGAATISTSFNATITIPLVAAGAIGTPPPTSASCALGPIVIASSTGTQGGSAFTGSPLTGTTAAIGFTVPAIVGSDADPLCTVAFASQINTVLGLPSTHTNAMFTAVETTPVVPDAPVVPGFTG